MLTKKVLLNYLPLALVLILASILRFLWLDKIPNAIVGDELTYILTAKSVALSGSDLTGTWNPLSIFLFHYPPHQMQAELSYFLLLPVMFFSQLSLLSSRLVFGLMSIFTVLFIYLISKQLYNKNIAIFTGLVAAINPWFIYIGRTAYESVPATLFFLVGFYCFLNKGIKKIYFGFFFFVLAFYSYIGTKIIFFPFVLAICLYAFYFIDKKKYLKHYLIILLLSFLLVSFYAFSIKNTTRVAEIISPNNPLISKQVDYLRSTSIKNPLTNILESKPAVFINIIADKFAATVSTDYLFSTGDEFFSNLNHGLFYIIDFIFLILGIGFAFVKNKKTALFLIILAGISLIPHLVHQISLDNFTPHISLFIPLMIVFIGVGISEIITIFKSNLLQKLVLGLILIVYLFFLTNFLNIYFYQFPLKDSFDFSSRVVAKYIAETTKNVIVYSPRNADSFYKYLFYSNRLNKKNLPQITQAINAGKYKLGNVLFTSCNNTLDFSKTNATVIYDSICGNLPKELDHLAVAKLLDGGQTYQIFHDSFCTKYNLGNFPSNISINDFSVENQTPKKFCETFITHF